MCCGMQAWGQARIDPSLPEAPLPHRRVLLLFPGYETIQDPVTPVATLRASQKFEMFWRKSLDPSIVIESAALSGIYKPIGYGPDYGTGWSSYGQLLGYNAANLSSTYLFTDAVLPILFRQDPRYFRKGSGSAGSRIWWAMRSEAVADNDNGKPMANYSGLLGFAMATALSNAYSPDSSVTFLGNLERYGVKLGVSFGLNVLREFGGLSKPEKY